MMTNYDSPEYDDYSKNYGNKPLNSAQKARSRRLNSSDKKKSSSKSSGSSSKKSGRSSSSGGSSSSRSGSSSSRNQSPETDFSREFANRDLSSNNNQSPETQFSRDFAKKDLNPVQQARADRLNASRSSSSSSRVSSSTSSSSRGSSRSSRNQSPETDFSREFANRDLSSNNNQSPETQFSRDLGATRTSSSGSKRRRELDLSRDRSFSVGRTTPTISQVNERQRNERFSQDERRLLNQFENQSPDYSQLFPRLESARRRRESDNPLTRTGQAIRDFSRVEENERNRLNNFQQTLLERQTRGEDEDFRQQVMQDAQRTNQRLNPERVLDRARREQRQDFASAETRTGANIQRLRGAALSTAEFFSPAAELVARQGVRTVDDPLRSNFLSEARDVAPGAFQDRPFQEDFNLRPVQGAALIGTAGTGAAGGAAGRFVVQGARNIGAGTLFGTGATEAVREGTTSVQLSREDTSETFKDLAQNNPAELEFIAREGLRAESQDFGAVRRFATENVPAGNLAFGDSDRFKEQVQASAIERGFTEQQASDLANDLARTRVATQAGQTTTVFGGNVGAEVLSSRSFSELPSRLVTRPGRQSFDRTGRAGAFDGATAVAATQRGSFEEFDAANIAVGGASGALTAGTVSSVINTGRSGNIRLRRDATPETARVSNIIGRTTETSAFLTDLYEKPADLVARRLPGVRNRESFVQNPRGLTRVNNRFVRTPTSVSSTTSNNQVTGVRGSTINNAFTQTPSMDSSLRSGSRSRVNIFANTQTQSQSRPFTTTTQAQSQAQSQAQTQPLTTTQTQSQSQTSTVPFDDFRLFPFSNFGSLTPGTPIAGRRRASSGSVRENRFEDLAKNFFG